MLVHNSVSSDGRVIKEATSLAAAGWRVVVVGIVLDGDSSEPAVEELSGFTIWRVMPRLWARQMPGTWGKLLRLLAAIPATIRQLRAARAGAYHAHDFPALAFFAMAGIWRRPIVYDSHEMFFDRWPAGSDYPLLRVMPLLRLLEKALARRASALITVSQPIAEVLSARLAIPRALVVMNAVDLRLLEEPVPLPRQRGQRIVAHSGYLSRGRHLPELVTSLQHLPEDVALALIGDGVLREELVAQAEAMGVAHRLLTIYPVNPFNLPTTLAQADCAVLLFTADGLNYQLALPNKFFEAAAAGLPLVHGPTQEISRLAREYDFGAACDPTDPRSIAAAIQTVLEPEASTRYRANAIHARDHLNWEHEERKLVELYRMLLDEKVPQPA